MEFFKGDTIELEITANTDITDWKIRVEFYDKEGHSVQLATTNAGGSDSQISIDNVSDGVFIITCPAGETTDFENNAFLEIDRIDNNGKKLTIFQSAIVMKDKQINWSNPS